MKWGGLFLCLFLIACSQGEEPVAAPDSFETMIGELRSPWDIEHDGSTFYVTERDGTIASWTEADGLGRLPVETNQPITQEGEGGLLGFALFPDFEESNRAFAYHTYRENSSLKNRVIVIEKENQRWVEKDVLLADIPGAQFHNGGRLEIGPDEKLYVTTGDALEESLAQDVNSLAGKLLRMDMDGSIPNDNPLEGSYVYSYGHRNPQGIAWSDTGDMYASEHGPDNHDEINRIEAGENYGWPEIVGEEEREGLQTPLYETGRDTWAPSGIETFNDRLIIASLRGTALRSMALDGSSPEVVTDGYGRIRDVELIDGALYFVTNNTDGRGQPDNEDDRLIRYDP
ncbi:quinoprotein glucose dehydrogenase [Halobacillus fulvus]|nr:quinoprotein glucose dehydrogenase [Halobacillus fulvus]